MTHPNPDRIEQIFTDLRTFVKERAIAPKNQVNMRKGYPTDLPCGTAVCHGGWLAVMAGLDEFDKGADWLANELGLGGMHNLKIWAANHPELWGNDFGGVMFGMTGLAFGLPDKTHFSIDVICDHWLAVADRIRKQEPNHD